AFVFELRLPGRFWGSSARDPTSNSRRAVPVGFRRPFSQLIAVTLETLSNWANTDWLTANCTRIATISLGLIGLTERGNVTVLVRSVIFSLPAAWRARVSTLLTKSSALNSISLRFIT